MWRKLTDLFSCVGVMSSICHERDPILSRTIPGFPTVHCCTAFTDCKYLYISYLFISHHKQQQWHLGLVRRLKYALNCFVSLNSSEWAALSLQSWACLVCTPAVLPYCSTKEIIISALQTYSICVVIHVHWILWCLLLLSKQNASHYFTSPREFTSKRHHRMMGLHSSPQHCIRFLL